MNKARTLAQMHEHSHGLVVSRLRYRINPTCNEERDYVKIRFDVRKYRAAAGLWLEISVGNEWCPNLLSAFKVVFNEFWLFYLFTCF